MTHRELSDGHALENTTMGNSGSIIGTIAIFLVIVLVVFLVCREIVCWYWKINKSIALLTEIRDLLANDARISRSPEPPKSATEEADGSLSAARNLAASGHSAAQISEELQKWRGLDPAEANALAQSVVLRS